MKLVCFDLDHTLLDGDSDVLWCDFLMDRGVLDRNSFAARNAAMERDYKAGTVSAAAFSAFYMIAIRLLPPIVVTLPLFPLADYLGLSDTHIFLILLYATFWVSLYTMIMNNSIHTNPPLCITDEQLAEGFEIIDRALGIADQAVTG